MPPLPLPRQRPTRRLPASTDLRLIFSLHEPDPLHVALLLEENGDEESSALYCVESTSAVG
jgi:hypothetical protein